MCIGNLVLSGERHTLGLAACRRRSKTSATTHLGRLKNLGSKLPTTSVGLSTRLVT